MSGNEYTGGLVGHVGYNSVVNRATVTEMTVTGGDYTGGLAGGEVSTANVLDCAVSGVVSGGASTGGVFGVLRGRASGCVSFAEVQGARAVGGLAGSLEMEGAIDRCYAAGAVTAQGTSTGQTKIEAGGLVGVHTGMEIKNSFALGTVNAGDQLSPSKALAGGLVGRNEGSISFSYAANQDSAAGVGVQSDHHAGGLLGTNIGVLYELFAANNVAGGAAGFCGPVWAEGPGGPDTYYQELKDCECGTPVDNAAADEAKAEALFDLPVTNFWDLSDTIWILVPYGQASRIDYPALR